MDWEPSGVLYGRVNIPKIAFQRVLPVEGIGAGRMEYQIHRAHRFVHAVGDGQPGLSDLAAWVRYPATDRFPGGPDRVDDVGAGCTEDGFGLGQPGLDESDGHAAVWARLLSPDKSPTR